MGKKSVAGKSLCRSDGLELIQLNIIFLKYAFLIFPHEAGRENHRGLVKAFCSPFRQAL